MTEWWQILAAIGAIGAIGLFIVEVLRYGLPRYKEWKERRANALVQSKEALSHFLESVERWLNIAPFYIENMQRLIKDADTPRPLRKRLREVERLVAEYLKWLPESDYIIDKEIDARCKDRENLIERWECFRSGGISSLPIVLREEARKMIYEGGLDFDRIKEIILRKYGRDYSVTVNLIVGDVEPIKLETIKLKEVVDSADFYSLIERLKDLEHRAIVETLRDAEKRLISEANDALKWINKRLNI